MLRISNHHNQSLFHSLVARKIPKQQQQQSDQNNNIHSSNPNAKTHKKKKKKIQTEWTNTTQNRKSRIFFYFPWFSRQPNRPISIIRINEKKKDYREMGFGEANAGEVFGFGYLQRQLVETSLAWLSFAFFVIVLLVRVRILILESSFSESVISFCLKKISNSILNKWESFCETVDHVTCASWGPYNFSFCVFFVLHHYLLLCKI